MYGGRRRRKRLGKVDGWGRAGRGAGTSGELTFSLPTQFEKDVEAFGTWRSWLPKVDYLVGWSYIYPKKGVVKKFPVQDPATSEFSEKKAQIFGFLDFLFFNLHGWDFRSFFWIFFQF
jgi:hypothetical protein